MEEVQRTKKMMEQFRDLIEQNPDIEHVSGLHYSGTIDYVCEVMMDLLDDDATILNTHVLPFLRDQLAFDPLFWCGLQPDLDDAIVRMSIDIENGGDDDEDD